MVPPPWYSKIAVVGACAVGIYVIAGDLLKSPAFILKCGADIVATMGAILAYEHYIDAISQESPMELIENEAQAEI
ncbi:hypothetical protein RHHCN13_05805 [Rickettsia conorii subsp. heilongjiangensis]|uniref:Uncharacterized protein n=1 Tax=Rickettsia conorii subsp. heilongjiangensis TaxID=226665 RepID=A0AAD1LT59_RICCR|nr:hypothetical protein [Rickettsia conorii]AEK75116.1 hypothetical protein Rh054_06265 [Rickettsia conorii subsp. heilongjiangensis 054]BBM91848.1 hypothetical protein RHCH81_05805 [Rickettsia conorii subsp. heilongjiangensis]BBM93057.1 hypothetical protein RHHCN13_05805 [Rickettsia conorii subsp. heilongjiangensis]BBM94266.1 hypothetical protein RHSENDAI29_05805 [Rickettsia conorii subsp. heilongjiangensis]BBM95475.1 hypothetical protein RHSENDAI58_05805 [Rickettsia conorii subsp. heilongjia